MAAETTPITSSTPSPVGAIAGAVGQVFQFANTLADRLVPGRVSTRMDAYEYAAWLHETRPQRDFTYLYIIGALLVIWLVVIVNMMRR